MNSRGHTNVEEVERFMRNHDFVKNAAVVLLYGGLDVEVVGFITLRDLAIEAKIRSLGQFGGEYERQQVQV